jgi:DNA-binding NarL/FixJ family response regulator
MARALTPSEKRMESLIIQGMCHKDIARALDIRLNSVKVVTSRILRKRGAESMHQLTAIILWQRIREFETRLGPSVAESVLAGQCITA